MRYIRANRLDGEILYSVFNSQGELMLYTRNQLWAEQIAKAFQDNPQTREVIVEDPAAGKPKRG